MSYITDNLSRSLRWMHEFLFSLNLAWVIVWIERVKTHTLGGRFSADYLSGMVRGANQLVSPFGGHTVLDQLVWSFAFAIVGFFSLRLLSRFSVTRTILRFVAGAAAIAAFPIAALFFGLTYPSCCTGSRKIGLGLELALILFCGVLFYLRKQPISGWIMVLALTLHFTVWAWATGSYMNVPEFVNVLRNSSYYHPWPRTLGSLSLAMVFFFGFPAIGLLAAMTWVRYTGAARFGFLDGGQISAFALPTGGLNP